MAGAEPAPPSPSALTPFRHPVFRAVWIASLASNFGGLIQSVGASWMMTSIAPTADMVALVQASTTLPIMLFSLLAGAIADNFDRRRMMLAAQIFMLLVSAGLAACTYMGLITPWLLLCFTFLIGCGAAFNGPAWQSSVGDMVPRADLPAAVTLNSVGFNIARSVGPAIGGAIVAAAGAAAAFAVNAVSYFGLIIVLARWRPAIPAPLLPRESIASAMAAGLRYVAMSPNIRSVLARAILFGVAASSVPALMPLIARDLVGGGPLTYGLLLGAFGIGAVCGAFASGQLRRRLSVEGIVRLGFAGFAVAAVVAATSPYLVMTMAALFIAGAGWVLALSTFNVSIQLSAPRWVVGRALSLYQMAAFGGMAGGSWLWGAIARDAGVSESLLASAAVQLAGIVVGLRFALPEIDALNLDPLRRWTEPETAVAIKPRSGPVVITIEYRIAQEDILEFLAVMADRKRIRRRDGARHWSLLRDLADPMLWVERYHSPTWTDYVRQNQRVTHADAEVGERLHALHRGPGKIVVHRMIERQTGSIPTDAEPHARELAAPLTDPARLS